MKYMIDVSRNYIKAFISSVAIANCLTNTDWKLIRYNSYMTINKIVNTDFIIGNFPLYTFIYWPIRFKFIITCHKLVAHQLVMF